MWFSLQKISNIFLPSKKKEEIILQQQNSQVILLTSNLYPETPILLSTLLYWIEQRELHHKLSLLTSFMNGNNNWWQFITRTLKYRKRREQIFMSSFYDAWNYCRYCSYYYYHYYCCCCWVKKFFLRIFICERYKLFHWESVWTIINHPYLLFFVFMILVLCRSWSITYKNNFIDC